MKQFNKKTVFEHQPPDSCNYITNRHPKEHVLNKKVQIHLDRLSDHLKIHDPHFLCLVQVLKKM